MTRQFAPPQSSALAVEIESGWRGDMSPSGRALKEIGQGARTDLLRKIERAAASESGRERER